MSVVSITYHGHACFGISVGEIQLLTDPFLSDNPLADVGAKTVDADYILVSHGHGDHVGDTGRLPRGRELQRSRTLRLPIGCRAKG
jgi:L-ascorbate metabolism protein UlaG (beta-lactamase superfamily)